MCLLNRPILPLQVMAFLLATNNASPLLRHRQGPRVAGRLPLRRQRPRSLLALLLTQCRTHGILVMPLIRGCRLLSHLLCRLRPRLQRPSRCSLLTRLPNHLHLHRDLHAAMAGNRRNSPPRCLTFRRGSARQFTRLRLSHLRQRRRHLESTSVEGLLKLRLPRSTPPLCQCHLWWVIR